MPTREPSLLRRMLASFALLALSVAVACSSGDARRSDADPLPTGAVPVAMTLARAANLSALEPTIAARLAPSAHGFERDDATARGPGRAATDLAAELPALADAPMRFAHGPQEAFATRWRLLGARSAPLQLDAGRAVFRGAFAHVDLLLSGERARAELFLLLHDEAAPTTFRWRITRGAGLVDVRRESSGALAFVDAARRARLRIGAPIAFDAKGTRRNATLSWHDDVLTLALDARGLSFPVLLDPPIETVEWDRADPQDVPLGRAGFALAFDSVRARTVLFGGQDGMFRATSDTWEWDGSTWSRRAPAASPSARYGQASAFDRARGKTVFFGGRGPGGALNDTWEWDGADWTLRTPAVSPPARLAYALAFDQARRRVVLFGGQPEGGAALADTWEWDGASWTQRTPAASPPARGGHAMAYDAARGKVVLFGGFGPVSLLADTWEWDGTAWTERTPATSPPPREGHALAFDEARGRCVLFGGAGDTVFLADTWEWDGAGWSQRSTPLSPPARRSARLVYDGARGRAVLFGGETGWHVKSDTWEWDGAAWTRRLDDGAPNPYFAYALAFDRARGETLFFGGRDSGAFTRSADTWTRRGTTWTRRSPAVSPPARSGHALANDERRAEVVLVGGYGGATPAGLVDTWVWDGATWTQRFPATSPAARGGHAMAFDAKRGVTVLFGGDPTLTDTWEWDGANWTLRSPAKSPPGLSARALAYDRARGVTVLVGGYGTAAATWEWDGTTWSERTPAVGSPGFHGPLVYDEGRRRVLAVDTLALTREWDGTTWTMHKPAQSPSPREGFGLAYDSLRRETVLFGGESGSLRFCDTWVYWGAGATCTTDVECHGATCVDGVCCDSACGGGDPNDCVVCSAALGASADGVCTTLPDGAACSDGAPCTGVDACVAGTCASGPAVTCAALDECHVVGACEPASGVCSNPPTADGAACSDDGNPCTADACRAGTCAHEPGHAGTSCRASAGPCDLEERCSGTSPDCPTDGFAAAGTSCGAASACDGSGRCSAQPLDAGDAGDAGADVNADAQVDTADADRDVGAEPVADGDAGADAYAQAKPPEVEASGGGCGCRSAGGESAPGALGGATLGLELLRRRRRSRRASRP